MVQRLRFRVLRPKQTRNSYAKPAPAAPDLALLLELSGDAVQVVGPDTKLARELRDRDSGAGLDRRQRLVRARGACPPPTLGGSRRSTPLGGARAPARRPSRAAPN